MLILDLMMKEKKKGACLKTCFSQLGSGLDIKYEGEQSCVNYVS